MNNLKGDWIKALNDLIWENDDVTSIEIPPSNLYCLLSSSLLSMKN